MTERLSGKVAVVTGGGGGIGAASARAMAAEGATVVVGDVDIGSATECADAIRADGGTAVPELLDVGQEDSVFAVLASAVREFGRLDILHNNALGVRFPPDSERLTNVPSDFVHDSEGAWFDALMHGTVTATMFGIKHAVPHLRAAGGGSIINTASVSGLRGEIATPGYGAGKAGVIQLTRSVAAAYGSQGIRCNAICPGFIVNSRPVRRGFDDRILRAWVRQTPMSRLGDPADIAPLVVYLASDESSYVTGQAIVVDGGFSMHDAIWADRRELGGPE